MITTQIDDTGFHLIDTQDGSIRTFSTQQEFAYASLVEILRHAEEIDAGLSRLQASYTHRTSDPREQP